MRQALLASAMVAVGVFFACSSSSPTPFGGEPIDGSDAAKPADTTGSAKTSDTTDATAPDGSDGGRPTGACAATFGDKLTAGFGRIDGILYAIQKPSDTQCVLPNGDHVILQILMNGAVYRLVVNVQGSGADSKIRMARVVHALPAPTFTEGWHADAPLDYLATLGIHTGDNFAALTLDESVAKVAASMNIGDPVAIYATSGAGRPESAHLIHRNKTNQDGAIVVNPTTEPTFLLFHFGSQTF